MVGALALAQSVAPAPEPSPPASPEAWADPRLTVRDGLALWIDAQSVSGSVTSDLDVGGDEGEAEGGVRVELRARSVSGDIRITRAAPTAG